MINFEEELEKYEPSPDVEQVEDVVNNNNLTDVSLSQMHGRRFLCRRV